MNSLWQWTVAGVFLGLALTGCRRSGGEREPEITGRRSDPPLTLPTEWKPGFRYLLRLDMTVNTDSETGRGEEELHSVVLGQDFAVTVTNLYPDGRRKLEIEILAIDMQRSKGSDVALMYDSASQGEVTDLHGFIPVLNRLIGGRVRVTVTPEGKAGRVEGVSQLMAAGVNSTGPSRTLRRLADGTLLTNLVAAPTNQPIVRRSATASAIRNLFTTEFFRQLVEINYAPGHAIRVGDQWKASRDFYFNSTVGQLTAETTTTFRGWQKQAQPDGMRPCARLELEADLAAKPTPLPALAALTNALTRGTNAPVPTAPADGAFEKGVLHGTVWIDPELAFPITRQFSQSVSYTSAKQTLVRMEGTNRITQRFGKKVDQSTTLRLTRVDPVAGPPAAVETLEKEEAPSE
ncbi:MAG TPA: hypothetical protein VNO52_09930 [Methylomirabilota bacterium]|nr:hypothetical protein [Methylomirabilota bacterium]